MYDFLKVEKTWDTKKQRYVYTPGFRIGSNVKDLMVRGGKFYGLYNPETGLWETRDPRAVELIDEQVYQYVCEKEGPDNMNDTEHGPYVRRIADQRTGLIRNWHNFCENDFRGDWKPLNQKVIFSNQEAKRADYASVKLDYPLQEGSTPYYDKICSKLYLPSEQEKWEWYVGAILCHQQREIQKMVVFYGEPGTGKSTVIGKIIAETLFGGFEYGYVSKFEANNLCGRDTFGTQFLEKDAVLAYDDDAEMQVITSKTTLNKIISHEALEVNPKFGRKFTVSPNCLLIVGSNEPVQLSPNSGMNRRLIDIRPTGNKLSAEEYDEAIEHLQFEKSGIAWRCYSTFKRLGKHYYDKYIAEDMLNRTSPFQNFVVENYIYLKDGSSLANAYDMYVKYAETCHFKNILVRHKFRDTLKLYYQSYNGTKFEGFKVERIGLKPVEEEKEEIESENLPGEKNSNHWLIFDETSSLFDKVYADCPAQYATEEGTPQAKWANVTTTLKDINSHKLHYVLTPGDLIILDFDIRGADGNKSYEKNLTKAEKYPPTYAELSKSGAGIHLHYIWTGGDPDKLSRVIEDNVEVKVAKGNSALRRMVTKCNSLPISELSSGLPFKDEGGKKKVLNWEGFKNERALRKFVVNCMLKRHHGYTKPECDYMKKTLDEAYDKGFTYDLRDMQQDILVFALSSTNKSEYCIDIVNHLKLCSKDVEAAENERALLDDGSVDENAPIIFLDVEVSPSARQAKAAGTIYPNDIPDDTPAHFIIVWKYQGENSSTTAMIDPTPHEVESLFKYRIIAHNGKSYDANMCYAAAQGYTAEELYRESQMLISDDPTLSKRAKFFQASKIFYADTYEYPVKKQSLKKWEIELGINHLEWDKPFEWPVPNSELKDYVNYCKNDVVSLEAVFNETQADFIAKEMLADLAGGSVIDTTNSLSTKFVKGDSDHLELIYTDFTTGKQYGDGVDFKLPIISEEEYLALGDDWTGVKPNNINHFPGYHYVRMADGKCHNMFRGIDLGRGGYVYNKPGMYGRAVTKDSASHHPSSIEQLNLFGKQTSRYSDLKKARYAIKHKDYDTVKKMFDGKLTKYLDDPSKAKALSTALKLVLNAFYGMTSSPHDYFEAKDPRNINNIVALRGAIVLKIIQDEVESRGFTVIHIKTDSIKIADPTDDILKLVDDLGKKYGYTFEVEHTWNRICLMDRAQFIGMHDYDDPESPFEWDAVGAKFKHPYIFKSLFTKEEITLNDMKETFSVTSGSIHLIFNEGGEFESDKFIGRCGQFTPVIQGHGGHLYRIKDGKRYAVAGSTNKETKSPYEFVESDTINEENKDIIDISFYLTKVNDCIEDLKMYGQFDEFTNSDPNTNINVVQGEVVEKKGVRSLVTS